MPPRGKNWCLTINNPEEECAGFDEIIMQYLICGIEVGEKGTRHIQGYVQFKDRQTLGTVKSIWPRAHLEIARGSPEKNVLYCSKEGKSHEHGECLKGQGARSDLDDIKQLIDLGAGLADIRDSNYGSYIRYNRSIIADREFVIPNRSWPTELHIRWGASGTGKSRYCADTYPDAYWKTRGEWWDGYDGHETVVIDDFYGWLKFDDILRLCDRYPLRTPYKGGFKKFVAKRIIITSNVNYRDWFPNITNEELWRAFERRITSCIEFTDADLVNQIR